MIFWTLHCRRISSPRTITIDISQMSITITYFVVTYNSVIKANFDLLSFDSIYESKRIESCIIYVDDSVAANESDGPSHGALQQKELNKRIGPKGIQVWNVAMHELHIFLFFIKQHNILPLGPIQPSSPFTKGLHDLVSLNLLFCISVNSRILHLFKYVSGVHLNNCLLHLLLNKI